MHGGGCAHSVTKPNTRLVLDLLDPSKLAGNLLNLFTCCCAELRTEFQKFDKDGSGVISYDDLFKALSSHISAGKLQASCSSCRDFQGLQFMNRAGLVHCYRRSGAHIPRCRLRPYGQDLLSRVLGMHDF
jgi:hypothetical protein